MDKIAGAVGELVSHQAMIEFLDYKKRAGSNTSKTGVSALASAALKGVNSVKSSMGIDTRGVKDGVIKVQYNPSSISFSAASKEKTASEQEGDYIVTTVSAACTITMSVDLDFYDNGLTDDPIKPQMDLFLAIMKQNWGRRIRFSWSNITFEGEASSIEVKYDMFDRQGNPVCSKVKLSIQGTSDDNVLEKAYKKLEEERKDTENEVHV